jgi:hypothetical protein
MFCLSRKRVKKSKHESALFGRHIKATINFTMLLLFSGFAIQHWCISLQTWNINDMISFCLLENKSTRPSMTLFFALRPCSQPLFQINACSPILTLRGCTSSKIKMIAKISYVSLSLSSFRKYVEVAFNDCVLCSPPHIKAP